MRGASEGQADRPPEPELKQKERRLLRSARSQGDARYHKLVVQSKASCCKKTPVSPNPDKRVQTAQE